MKSLVIEDDPGNRLLMQRILAKYGAVDAVSHAESALDLLFPLEETGFDLVVIDLLLPGKDGFSVAEAIRKAEAKREVAFQHRLKLLVVTALGDNEAVLRAYHSGADVFLRKPITITQIQSLLAELGFKPGDKMGQST